MTSIDSFVSILDRRLYRKGTFIFQDGDRPNCAYIVRRGSVDICKMTAAGPRQLATIGPNQIFGELALLDGQLRSAAAIAAEDSELALISADLIADKMAKLDPLMKYWVGYLVDRIRDLSRRVDP